MARLQDVARFSVSSDEPHKTLFIYERASIDSMGNIPMGRESLAHSGDFLRCKGKLKKQDLEVQFIPRLVLRFPPILAGTKSHLDHFYRTSKSNFFKIPLLASLLMNIRDPVYCKT